MFKKKNCSKTCMLILEDASGNYTICLLGWVFCLVGLVLVFFFWLVCSVKAHSAVTENMRCFDNWLQSQ